MKHSTSPAHATFHVEDRDRWEWVLMALSMLLMVLSAWRHEFWLDEWQAWLIAKASGTLEDLHHNTRYEGHGFPWVGMLWIAAKAGCGPWIMKVLNVGMVAGALFLFWRHAPFTRVERTLLLFNYYFIFEYGTISRVYGLTLLAAALFCWWAGRSAGTRRLTGALWALTFLAASGVFGMILSLALMLIVVPWHYSLPDLWKLPPRRLLLASLAFVSIFCVSVWWMKPAADNVFVPRSPFLWDPQRFELVAAIPWQGLFPLPELSPHFWNSNIVPFLWLQGVLGLVVVVFLVWNLRPRRVKAAFTTGVAGVLLFQYLFHAGFLRHHGHLFLLVLVCVWTGRTIAYGHKNLELNARLLLPLVLAVQVGATAWAVGMDIARPFSGGPAAAEDIRRASMAGPVLVVADPDYATVSLAGNWGASIYYPRGGRWGSFALWSSSRQRVDLDDLLQEWNAMPRDILWVTNDVPSKCIPGTRVLGFHPSLRESESLFVLKVPRESLASLDDLERRRRLRFYLSEDRYF